MNTVFFADLGEFLSSTGVQEKKAFLKRNSPFLTAERRRKIQFYHYIDDQIRSMMTYGLLAYALKTKKGIEGPLEFNLHENGKPFLRDCRTVFFNLSHCKNAVACIIGDDEVGIDVQDPFEYDEDLAKQICTQKERERMLKKGENDSKAINRLWVLKEAYTKYSGNGIMVDLKKIDILSEELLKNEGCSLHVVEKKDLILAYCVRNGTVFTENEVYLNQCNRSLYDLFNDQKSDI